MLKINKFIEEKKILINDFLKKSIEELSHCDKDFVEMINYSLFPGGKRLRPICLLSVLKTYQLDINIGLPIACAIEMLHTYSLIHDDLPCMDNDDLRRNKPTLHIKYSEAKALLTGDLLLTLAFETIANAKNIDNDKKNKIISVVAQKAGCRGMIGGQYLDILSENKEISYSELSKIHMKKTASLLSASFITGGILSNATEKELEALENFGIQLGYAYQIVDDILEASSNEKTIKKSISDKKNKKATAITVFGIEKAKEKVKELYEKGILNLSKIPYPPPLLKDLAYILIKRSF